VKERFEIDLKCVVLNRYFLKKSCYIVKKKHEIASKVDNVYILFEAICTKTVEDTRKAPKSKLTIIYVRLLIYQL